VTQLECVGEMGPCEVRGRSGPSASNIAGALFESEPRPHWWSLAAQHGKDEPIHFVVQAEQGPAGVLCEGEIRIEFGEKRWVSEGVVAPDPGFLEGPAGEVCQWVVDASDGEGGQVGGPVGDHAGS
jgi:hypothetical protein